MTIKSAVIITARFHFSNTFVGNTVNRDMQIRYFQERVVSNRKYKIEHGILVTDSLFILIVCLNTTGTYYNVLQTLNKYTIYL